MEDYEASVLELEADGRQVNTLRPQSTPPEREDANASAATPQRMVSTEGDIETQDAPSCDCEHAPQDETYEHVTYNYSNFDPVTHDASVDLPPSFDETSRRQGRSCCMPLSSVLTARDLVESNQDSIDVGQRKSAQEPCCISDSFKDQLFFDIPSLQKEQRTREQQAQAEEDAALAFLITPETLPCCRTNSRGSPLQPEPEPEARQQLPVKTSREIVHEV